VRRESELLEGDRQYADLDKGEQKSDQEDEE
jgi:hypothetical protein